MRLKYLFVRECLQGLDYQTGQNARGERSYVHDDEKRDGEEAGSWAVYL